MAWGGSSAGTGAAQVRKAFFEGRTKKVGNARTDGHTYFLFDNAIVRRRPTTRCLSLVVADKLEGKDVPPELEFTYAGWPTVTTRSHLDAFGIHATCYDGVPRFDGHIVDIHKWYTPESLRDLPMQTPDEIAKDQRRYARLKAKLEREAYYARTPELNFA